MPILKLKIKPFDNLLLVVYFLFLPFTYALTLNIGFPLKISEVALILSIPILFLQSRIFIQQVNIFSVLTIFIIVCFISTAINLFWTYPYRLSEYENRFGYKLDSVLKFVYLLLAYISFVVTSNAFHEKKLKYINYFLLGAVIVSIYSWYLFFSVLLRTQPLLLPGIDEPQYIVISMGTFIRSGTFKEGNYMGLFVFLAVVLSFYLSRKRLAFFFIATLLTTFSSVAFLCTALFLVAFYFKAYFKMAHLHKLIVFVVVFVTSFSALLTNGDFKELFVSKIFGKVDQISNSGAYSKVDRFNVALVGYHIGRDNLFFGVGLSNYSLHYNHYNKDDRFIHYTKRIPNNLYVEVFSEIGLIGLMLFLYFIFLLYHQTKMDETRIFRYGLVASLVYFVAFPTFTILFLWAFFGLISSLSTHKNEGDIY